MALTAAQTVQARAEIVSDVFGVQPATVTKPQIDVVSAAVSDWLDSVAASFNTAVSTTVLAGASTQVKTMVLTAVAKAKYGVG